MNTQSENDYQELHSDNTILFETIQTNKISYEYQFTQEIQKQFENWKLEVLELTDAEPTKLEILTYFRNLDVIGFSSYLSGGPDMEINITITNK
jgi:hypothetical protein